MLTHVDLFSGIGGFSLAAEWAGFKTVVFCEKDEYCQAVLRKHWPEVPIWSDIKTFKWPMGNARCERPAFIQEQTARVEQSGQGKDKITLLTGGFPCQPFSCSGKRRGKADDRYLWPEMFRVISEVRPTWVLAENVAGIVKMELDNCLSDLESEDYETETFIIPACAVDAPHRRDRVWIVANASSNGTGERYNRDSLSADNRELSKRRNSKNQENPQSDPDNRYQDVADNDKQCSKKYFRRNKLSKKKRERTFGWPYSPHRIWPAKSDMGLLADGLSLGLAGWCEWPEEPEDVPRVAKGVPERVNRLKALGNAIVPLVAYEIMRIIAVIEKNYEDEVAG